MRKITFLLLSLVLPVVMIFGKVVYVNQITGSDTYDGTTWAKAYKTLSYANGSSRTTTGDSIWVAGGATYVLTPAAANAAANSNSFYQNNKYWFGGFKGNETALSQRPLLDQDGNGVTESWEFQYPTTVSITLTDATGIVFGSGDFNGFTLTSTATYSSRLNYVYALNVSTKFVNNIIKNCTVTLNMATTANETYNPFFRARGTVDNCLFEKNNITVNAQNSYCYPFISIENSTTITIGTKFTNNIIRNNKVKIDYTSSTATSNSAIRGLIMNVLPALQTTGLPTTVANCVLHNNDMIYVPSASNVSGASLTNGASISISSQNSTACTDSLINCTVANNKGVKVKTGGIYIGFDALSYHYIMNNVFYNNQNSSDGTTFSVDNMSGSITSGIGIITNNFTNGGGLTNTAGKIYNQDNTLNTNSPAFKTPTLTIGTTTDNTSELSDWSIGSTSYLIGKGTTVAGRSLDKAGNKFQTPRAVGAYEFFQNCVIALSAGTTGGSIQSGAGNYNYGTSVTVVAKADAGYHFTGWAESGSLVSSTTSYNFAATKNRTLVASFLSNSISLLSGTSYASNYINCDSCKFDLSGSGTSLEIDNNATLNSVTINPGAKFTLNSGKTLTLSSIALKSDASGTGTFVDNGTATIGSASVQQYLTSGRNWYISTPVSSALTSSFSSAGSIVSYNEPSASWTSVGAGSQLIPGRGYISVETTTSGAISFSGSLNTGTITAPLTRTTGVTKEGFNLVANPYVSYLDWTKVDTAAANIIPTIWYRTKNMGGASYVFDTYNGLAKAGTSNGATSVSNLIPPMQAFWVRVKPTCTTGTLTLNNSMRSHADVSTNILKIPAETKSKQSLLRLKVSNGVNSDETLILFNGLASDSYDAYDSPKMSNAISTIPEIYTMADSEILAINSFKNLQSEFSVPVGFKTGESNTFCLKISELTDFDSQVRVVIKDNVLNTEQDITDGTEYPFFSDATSNNSRFALIFKSPSLTTRLNQTEQTQDNPLNVLIYLDMDNHIMVNCKELDNKANVSVYDVMGQKLTEQALNKTITAVDYPLIPGVYIISVVTGGKRKIKKITFQ